MKKFLTKIILFLLPLLIVGIAAEFLIRRIPNDYSYKNEFLDKNADDMEILFFGSSHTYYGIDPAAITEKAFNVSHISQSIDYDFEILKKYDGKLNRLKYIALPIDYFTLFSRLSVGIESWRVKNYEIYYDINKSRSLTNHSEVLSIKPISNLKRILSYYLKGNSSVTCSELGYGTVKRNQQDLEQTGITAAKRHTTSDRTFFTENTRVLNELIDFAEQRNIKVLLYTSPAFHTYVSNLDKNQLDMTSDVIATVLTNNPHCSYYNLLTDASFDSSHFNDADHLNDSGARKLTIKLQELMTQ